MAKGWTIKFSGVEQWPARWAHNPKVGGSNPSPATTKTLFIEGFFVLYKFYLAFMEN